MKSDQKIRAFIAITLPENIKDFLSGVQKQLKKEGFHASWPRPETMHLTLKFLGEMEADRVGDVKSCMEEAVMGLKNPIELSGAAVGVFPSVKNTRVIWSGIRGQTDILSDLSFCLNQRLYRKLGIPAEKKRFSPHLTLARVKSRPDPKKMIDILQRFTRVQSDAFTINNIRLYKSRLEPAGAVHKWLAGVTW